MALVDPNIAMSYRAPEFKAPNQLAQYAQMQQIMAGQQAQELNALKMQEAQAAMQERNALRGLNPTAPDYESQLFKVSPQLGIQYRKEQSAAEAQKAAAAASLATGAKTRQGMLQSAMRDISERPSDANITAHLEDVMASNLFTPAEKQAVKTRVDGLLALPIDQRSSMLASQGATPTELRPTIKEQGLGGTKQMLSIPAFGGQATVVPGSFGQVTAQPVAPAVAMTPEAEAQRVRIAIAGRAPAQPVAPTITQIVDPTDPNKMIAIDARRYQGGGAGSPGVIGVSGKEPGAALRQNKVEAGKTQLADDLDNLRESFKTLNKMEAIPSTERGPISNISSATAASGLGQMLGRATGTEAQVERDVINSARQRLVNSIKNATGMSAQQLNSNVELQTMLKSISDPGQSFQAAMRIIDDIENAYVKGTGELPKRSQSGKVTSTTIAPADKQALDWANANPKDPRALQIKQRLGQ